METVIFSALLTRNPHLSWNEKKKKKKRKQTPRRRIVKRSNERNSRRMEFEEERMKADCCKKRLPGVLFYKAFHSESKAKTRKTHVWPPCISFIFFYYESLFPSYSISLKQCETKQIERDTPMSFIFDVWLSFQRRQWLVIKQLSFQ